jgi:hypothetical protein
MVSQYTWPNFRGGADRDGVRILIQQQNFDEDVVYGKTKIFVRSPQTLFMLEQVSLKLIETDVMDVVLYYCCFILAGSRSTHSGYSHFSSKTMERIRLSSSL